MPKRTPAEEYPERFWAQVTKTETCWLWDGYALPSGYGQFHPAHNLNFYAHRYAYGLLVGPIPVGLTIDHVKANGCTSRLCVKAVADEHGPAHLEVVTAGENAMRGDSVSGINARKTHCSKGHSFDEINTYRTPQGHRSCRTCRREWMRARRTGRTSSQISLAADSPPPTGTAG